MLVEGRLELAEVKKALVAGLLLIVGLGIWLVFACHSYSRIWVILMLTGGLFMGLGYTVPPFKSCHRSLGELVVEITHSPYVILCGYVFQTGSWSDPIPWLSSIPFFFAVLGAITLAGIPDHEADKAVSKKTLSVLLSQRQAALLWVFCHCCLHHGNRALASDFRTRDFRAFDARYNRVWIILLFAISRIVKSEGQVRKIDSVMQVALSYIIWFGAISLAIYLGF